MQNLPQKLVTLPSGVTVRSSTGERYVIERLLGKGEMGAVYLVQSRVATRKRWFALKEVISPDAQDRRMFASEGAILTRLRHRALPRVYHIFENHKLERVYMLMDYIRGQNLETLIKKEPAGRFPLPLVLLLMAPIVEAVTYLHSQHPPVIHRDIKPANVIIPVDARGAKLVDFGSAKEYDSQNMLTVRARRSPGYAAPEQYSSGSNPRTDIYGLGATFYTLLTGQIPLESTQRLELVWGNKPDPLKSAHELVSDIPVSVSEALQKAMEINSDYRFESVEEFWQAMTSEVKLEDSAYQAQLPRVTSTAPTTPVPSPLDRQTKQMPVITLQDMQEDSVNASEQWFIRLLLILVFIFFIIVIVLGIHFFL